MALSKEDRDEIRQLFGDCTGGMSKTLEMILEQTKKTNGRVTVLEHEVSDAILEKERIVAYRDKKYQEFEDKFENLKDVPQVLRRLEDESLSNKSIRKWIVSSIAITGSVVSLIFLVIEHFSKTGI